MKNVTAFIDANPKAYAVFKTVALEIEKGHQALMERVAAAGVLPEDYRAFAVAFVAEDSKVEPYDGKFGGLVFKKNTTESNRVTYILQVLNGVAAVKAEARKAKAAKPKAGKAEKAGTPFEAACAAIALCSAAERKLLLALLAK